MNMDNKEIDDFLKMDGFKFVIGNLKEKKIKWYLVTFEDGIKVVVPAMNEEYAKLIIETFDLCYNKGEEKIISVKKLKK